MYKTTISVYCSLNRQAFASLGEGEGWKRKLRLNLSLPLNGPIRLWRGDTAHSDRGATPDKLALSGVILWHLGVRTHLHNIIRLLSLAAICSEVTTRLKTPNKQSMENPGRQTSSVEQVDVGTTWHKVDLTVNHNPATGSEFSWLLCFSKWNFYFRWKIKLYT